MYSPHRVSDVPELWACSISWARLLSCLVYVINISGNFNLFFEFVCLLVARRTVSIWQRILLCIYRIQFIGEFYFNTSVYWMFYFCYQQLFTWDMGKWLEKGGTKDVLEKEAFVSPWQVSPGGRQTPYISFHQERGKMGIPWVLCAFITSTIQVQLDVSTVSCFSLFLVCSPLACVHFQQCHRFAACLYFLLPGQLYSPFIFFFKLLFNLSLCVSPAILVSSESAYKVLFCV